MSIVRKSVAVLISGSGSNLQALIDAAAKPDFPASIALVISNKLDAYGLKRAAQAGIQTQIIEHRDYPDRDAFDAALHQALVAASIDLVCLAGFMRLLSADFVTQWQGRMINIHPSLLPSFKGLHTHQQAVDAGVKWAGCTVHFVVPEMDAGPIIAQAAVAVCDSDDAATLAARVLAQEHRIYPQALRWLAQDQLMIRDGKVRVRGLPDRPQAAISPSFD